MSSSQCSSHLESATNRQFSLRHFRHESKLYNSFYSMLKDENLVDVIVSCDGNNIKAHRLVLSANSAYFKNLFEAITSSCQIPVVFLKDVDISDMRAILEFMYKGEVSVDEKQLSSVLKCAELLKVYNLSEVCHALRSRLANEHNTSSGNIGVSGVGGSSGGRSDDTGIARCTPQKRPRINDGIHAPNVLLPQSTCNMRFDIRHGTANMTFNQRSPIFAQNSSPTSQSTTTTPTAKAISLPSNQIHSSNSITSAQNNSMTTQVIITSHSSELNIAPPKPIITSSSDRQTVIVPTISTSHQMNAINPKPPTTVWTPNSHLVTYSSRNNQLISDKAKTPAVEVTIDDEPHENFGSSTKDVSEDDIDVDIKPQIFEININGSENVSNKEDAPDLEIIQEKSSPSNTTQNSGNSITFVKTMEKSNKTANIESNVKSRPSNVKYRSLSTSSQSLPPPPSGRLVQRSTARLLRNIIKPPSSVASSSSVKSSKDGEEKAKPKKVIKKDKPSQSCVGVVKYRNKNIVNITLDPSSSVVLNTPEIECPSCGIVFHDEKNWNDHIANVHLPFQT